MQICFLFDDARKESAVRALKSEFDVCSGLTECNEKAPHAFVLPIPPTKDGIHPTGMMNVTLKELAAHCRRIAPTASLLGYGNCPADFLDFPYTDLSKDISFVEENAELTAEGGTSLLLNTLREKGGLSLMKSVAVILGYGRIARGMAKRLSSFGAMVLIGARRAEARREAESDRYLSFNLSDTSFFEERGRFLFSDFPHILINTVPSSRVISIAAKMPSPLFCLELSGKSDVKKACSSLPFETIDGSSIPARYTPEAAGIALAAAIRRSFNR